VAARIWKTAYSIWPVDDEVNPEWIVNSSFLQGASVSYRNCYGGSVDRATTRRGKKGVYLANLA